MSVRSIARVLIGALTSLPGRIAISALLLAAVALSVDWADARQSLEGAEVGWFGLAVVLVEASLLLGAIRWHGLVRAAGLPAGRGECVRAYMIGAFTSIALPTGFGGDLVRSWIVARERAGLARSLVSVVADRVSALVAFLVVAWLAVAVDPGSVPGALLGLLALATAAVVAGAGALVIAVKRPGRLTRLVPQRLQPVAADARSVLRAYAGDTGLLARQLAMGLAFQVLAVMAVWALARGLGLELDLALIAVVTPLVLLATLLPISIAGFGVREGAFAALLGEAGVATSDAVLISLLSVAAMAVASLPGGLLIITGGRPREIPADVLGDRPTPGPSGR
jgi:uncharacterized membrane protein YbhN (UPF0104 family)